MLTRRLPVFVQLLLIVCKSTGDIDVPQSHKAVWSSWLLSNCRTIKRHRQGGRQSAQWRALNPFIFMCLSSLVFVQPSRQNKMLVVKIFCKLLFSHTTCHMHQHIDISTKSLSMTWLSNREAVCMILYIIIFSLYFLTGIRDISNRVCGEKKLNFKIKLCCSIKSSNISVVCRQRLF